MIVLGKGINSTKELAAARKRTEISRAIAEDRQFTEGGRSQ